MQTTSNIMVTALLAIGMASAPLAGCDDKPKATTEDTTATSAPTTSAPQTTSTGTAGTPSAGTSAGVKMPANFQRDGFLANSMVVTKEPNNTGLKPGVHLIYVNPAGLDRLRQGGSTKYPEGTVFVDDVREFSVDDGVYHQGGHEFITTMVKDSKTDAS